MRNSLDCGGRNLSLETPVVMGILNVTPDSFSDGGQFFSREPSFKQAKIMVEAGAAIIDVGGESTRPGARGVEANEELDRVASIIEAIHGEFDIVVSIDTSKPEVMSGAVAAGAGMINDVRALQMPGALEAAARLNVPICLMHMQGEPVTMQDNPHYDNVVREVIEFLSCRMQACERGGIATDKLLVDPGFGFGKNLSHNLQLLKNLDTFTQLGAPLVVGISRKGMVGQVLDVPLERRLAGSLSAAVIAATKGAKIIRVHDVGATVQAIMMVNAIEGAAQPGGNTL
jgi:dihydropteroate synthase